MVTTLSATQSPIAPIATPTPQVSQPNTGSVFTAATTTTAPPPVANTAPPPVANTAAGNVYVEDLLGQQTAMNLASRFPVSFWQDFGTTKDEPSGIFTGQFNRDQSIVGAIWAQAITSDNPVTSKYGQITMTIRGDPYWLGQTNIQRQINLTVGNINVVKNDLPDWSTGSQAIFVYFRFPYTTGDDFKPNFKSSTMFTGIYRVVKVVHYFSEGVFKQELMCVIDPLSNPALWGNAPDAAPASTSTVPASPPVTPSPSSPTPPPPTPTLEQQTYNLIF